MGERELLDLASRNGDSTVRNMVVDTPFSRISTTWMAIRGDAFAARADAAGTVETSHPGLITDSTGNRGKESYAGDCARGNAPPYGTCLNRKPTEAASGSGAREGGRMRQ